ncbi:MAG: hypothetical protein OXU27_01390, partial [Candidatus Poribacteria bacterium]|nr:hypothetical protein [Candidatus Poribacteria bacterium]
WDTRSQAEKPIIKVAIATININDFIQFVPFLIMCFARLHFCSVRFGEIRLLSLRHSNACEDVTL